MGNNDDSYHNLAKMSVCRLSGMYVNWYMHVVLGYLDLRSHGLCNYPSGLCCYDNLLCYASRGIIMFVI
jgi:hypothetical protein